MKGIITLITREIGNCILHLADCREILPQLSDIDLVATDPPYGVNYVSNYRASGPTKRIAGDTFPPLDTVGLLHRTMKRDSAIYLCTRFDVWEQWRNALTQSGFKIKTTIVWDKGNWSAGDLYGDYGNQTELILYAHKGRCLLRNGRDHNLWRYSRPAAGLHPTPKPVELMERMIRNSSDVGATVLDPFMGSGTTGVAAVNLGRKFIGVELDEQYFQIACDKIEVAVNAKSSKLVLI